MADWNFPTLTSLYTDFMNYLKGRDEDAITLGKNPYVNPPTGALRWDRPLSYFQEWTGSSWIDLVISMRSGGLGSNTPAGGRAALGIGTMGVQDSNNVSITGGAISGLNSLGVNGAASTGPLTVSGDAYVTGTVTGVARVHTNDLISNANTATATLGVSGAANIGSLGVAGHLTANTAAVAYDITAGRNVNFAGNTWTGSLTVGGAANIAGAVSTGGLSVNGNIGVTGAVTTNAHVHAVTDLYAGSPANKLTVNGLLDSTKISGLIPTGNLGAGAANTGTFLRGDGTWQVVQMSSYRHNAAINTNRNLTISTPYIDIALGGFSNVAKMYYIPASPVNIGNFVDTEFFIGYFWFPNASTLRYTVTRFEGNAKTFYIAGMVLELI